jgi:hypothetical protein
MCFSASASFGAGLLITSIGIAAIKNAKTPSHKIFALTPLFFGVQQFSEGVIWLVLSNSIYQPWLPIATYLFLFFAWLVWPIFMPFSLTLLETESTPKRLLRFLLVLGGFVSIVLSYILISYPIEAKINDHHIIYQMDFDHTFAWLFGISYVFPTVLSCVISSVKRMWYFGAINLASYLVTKFFFNDYLVSIWCFFAALASVVVLVIVSETTIAPREEVPIAA